MSFGNQFGFAWIILAAVSALHVADEAATDFLAVYNPIVRAIRWRVPFLPLPTFTFRIWLTGLCVGIGLLFALSPYAYQGARWIVVAALPLSIVMFLNSLLHLFGSVWVGRLLPGVRSSPALLAASTLLFIAAIRHLTGAGPG